MPCMQCSRVFLLLSVQSAMAFELTESEAQRYDRQIRVWGAEAQSRIQNSKVLVCGLSKMNVEVVKNIVLAGMNVTLQDARSASHDDLSHNFFLGVADVGAKIVQAVLPRVQELNSFASILAEERSIDDLPDSFFQSFSVILLTDCSEAQALRINRICRSSNQQCAFFWSDMYGDEGLFYADFGASFDYKDDKQPGTSSTNGSSTNSAGVETAAVQKVKTLEFPALEVVVGKRWSEVVSRHFPLSRTFVKHRLLVAYRNAHGKNPACDDAAAVKEILANAQSSNGLPAEPAVLSDAQLERLCSLAGTASVMAASVLGSYLSQEVVKAVSHTGEPAFNVFVFSAEDFEAKAFPVR